MIIIIIIIINLQLYDFSFIFTHGAWSIYWYQKVVSCVKHAVGVQSKVQQQKQDKIMQQMKTRQPIAQLIILFIKLKQPWSHLKQGVEGGT